MPHLDWVTIWNKQTLYPALANELIRLAFDTQKFLTKQAGGGLVRTISRTLAVWDDYKKVPFELSDDLLNPLFPKRRLKQQKLLLNECTNSIQTLK